MSRRIAKAIVYFLSGCVLACNTEQTDKDIKAAIAVNAKTTIAFAGVNYTVANGIDHLTGVCPTTKEKDEVEAAVRKLAPVKDVVNDISIGSVVLDENFSLKQSVDSVLKNYNGVIAQVSNGTVTLYGQIKSAEVKKLTDAVSKLPVAGIENQLTIQ